MLNVFAADLRRRAELARFGKRKRRKLRRPPRWSHPDAVELSYRRVLLGLVDQMAAATERRLLIDLPFLDRAANPYRADDWVDDLARLIAALRTTFSEMTDGAEQAALAHGLDVSQFNREQFRKIVQAVLGVDVFAGDPDLLTTIRAFAKENAALIKTIPERLLSDVETIALRGLRGGERPEVVAARIRERFDVSKARAKLIARDQIASLNGELTQIRQANIGITQYIWRTSRDERVRESHAAREGKTFDWERPPSDGHPGKPINCRCYAEPVLDPLLEGL